MVAYRWDSAFLQKWKKQSTVDFYTVCKTTVKRAPWIFESLLPCMNAWHSVSTNPYCLSFCRSFNPFFPLLECFHTPGVQLWAAWAMQHVCSKNGETQIRSHTKPVVILLLHIWPLANHLLASGCYLFTFPKQLTDLILCLPVRSQPLVTAACCWRRAACSSWSSFIHTHRPTRTSNGWRRAFWRACRTTELALARLHRCRQVAVRRHNSHTQVKRKTL